MCDVSISIMYSLTRSDFTFLVTFISQMTCLRAWLLDFIPRLPITTFSHPGLESPLGPSLLAPSGYRGDFRASQIALVPMFKQCYLAILNIRAILFASVQAKSVRSSRWEIQQILDWILRDFCRDWFYIKVGQRWWRNKILI